MPSNLRPYSDYRDSGLCWLGAIPTHWRLQRAKTLLRAIDVRSATGDEELLTVSSARGVVPRRTANVTMFQAESYVGHKLCWPGDLVINSLWAWSRGLGVARSHGIVSSAYGVYRPLPAADLDPLFLHYLARSEPFHWELRVRSKGVWTSRLQLTDEAFLAAPLPVPPRSEQAAIVRFLDDLDRRVDRFVRNTGRLTELIREQQQLRLSSAVTGGLPQASAVTSAGRRWLNNVPHGWSVMPLGAVASVQTGPFGSQLHASDYVTGGLPVLNPAHIRAGQIQSDIETTIGPEKAVELSKHRLKPGDIVAARRGELGRSAVVQEEHEGWLCGTGSLRIRCRPTILLPEFLALVLNTPEARLALSMSSVGATMDNLSGPAMARLLVPVPPINEQETLTVAARVEGREVEARIATMDRQVEMIREYRARLTADAVTGQVDVRDRAANLPEVSLENSSLESLDGGESGESEDEDCETVADVDEVPA